MPHVPDNSKKDPLDKIESTTKRCPKRRKVEGVSSHAAIGKKLHRKRAAAGRFGTIHATKGFIPSDEQRAVVISMKGMGVADEMIRLAVLNPETRNPIGLTTLKRVFARELEIGMATVTGMYSVGMAKNLRGGNVTSGIWWSKNMMGWRDSPAEVGGGVSPGGAAAPQVVYEMAFVGPSEVIDGVPPDPTKIEEAKGDALADKSKEI
jgi:hypothetical protein